MIHDVPRVCATLIEVFADRKVLFYPAMQCGSPSQSDRWSKKLTAIEQRIEDVLMRISQESGNTEAVLRDLNASVAQLTTTVERLHPPHKNLSSISSFPKLGILTPRSESRDETNAASRGENRVTPTKSSKTDVSAILRSDRSEILAMESQPLLDSGGRKEAKKNKAQKLVKKCQFNSWKHFYCIILYIQLHVLNTCT